MSACGIIVKLMGYVDVCCPKGWGRVIVINRVSILVTHEWIFFMVIMTGEVNLLKTGLDCSEAG